MKENEKNPKVSRRKVVPLAKKQGKNKGDNFLWFYYREFFFLYFTFFRFVFLACEKFNNNNKTMSLVQK